MDKRKKTRRLFWVSHRQRKIVFAKGVSVIPHLFTLGNAFFGFISIIFASQGAFVASSYCILIGALMDVLDGRIARLLDAETPLGVELDSLCDAITFCLAPAILIYYGFLLEFGPIGIFASAMYVLAGVFRLARFNLIHDQQTVHFLGLPTTMAACLLSTLMLNIKAYVFELDFALALLFLMLGFAFLMVSSVSFPAFKKIKFKNKNTPRIIIAVLFAFIIVFKFKRSLLFILSSYIVGSLIMFIIKKIHKR